MFPVLFPLFLLSAFTCDDAKAQRVQEGCFEASPPSCNDNAQVDVDSATAQSICSILEWDYLPWDPSLVQDLTTHAEYLNTILVQDDLCSQAKAAYHQCWWCADDYYPFEFCKINVNWNCTDPNLTKEDRWFNKTEEEVEQACQTLHEIYWQDWYYWPSTQETCENERQIYHLCTDYCIPKGEACFDVDPPSCEPLLELEEIYQEPSLNISNYTDLLAICDEISWLIPWWSTEGFFNISSHADNLRHINIGRPDSNTCLLYQAAYPYCRWCEAQSGTGCFDVDPPSCDGPPDWIHEYIGENDEEEDLNNNINVNELCRNLYDWLSGDEYLPYNHSLHAPFYAHIKANTTECQHYQYAYHQCYFCAANVTWNFCYFDSCDQEVPSRVTQNINLEETCSELEVMADARDYPFTKDLCYRGEIASKTTCPEHFCGKANSYSYRDDDYVGFNEEVDNYRTYLGATTISQKKALIWASRSAAFLSFLGASVILWDILAHPKSRATVYHQLLIGMAIFDICTAVAWSFATAPIPKEIYYVEGALGNDATCTAQAFFIQLGFTSVFYNVSLALYYMLIIVYDWRESRLKTIRIYLHVLPIILGLVLACGGIPKYHWIEYGCHLSTPPEGDMWAILIFVVLPLGISITSITVSMGIVYAKVRKQALASAKWKFGIGKSSTLERDVFWQCFWYVLAFYITWPILFSVYLASVDTGGPFGLTVTVAFVAPIQGFNNFLVYLRPKVNRYLRNREKKTRGQQHSTSSRISNTGQRTSTISTWLRRSNPLVTRLSNWRTSLSRSTTLTSASVDMEQPSQLEDEDDVRNVAEKSEEGENDDEMDPSAVLSLRPLPDPPETGKQAVLEQIPEEQCPSVVVAGKPNMEAMSSSGNLDDCTTASF